VRRHPSAGQAQPNTSLTAADLLFGCLCRQCEALEAQLAPLRGATNLVSKEDLKKTEKRFEAVFGEYRKRKRMFKCVFDQVLESSEKKPKILQVHIHRLLFPPASKPKARLSLWSFSFSPARQPLPKQALA
jgi:hypothetical protein